MRREWWFPTLTVAISLAASGVYALKGDFRHALYYFFGAAITASATY